MSSTVSNPELPKSAPSADRFLNPANGQRTLLAVTAVSFGAMVVSGAAASDGGRQFGFAWLLNVWFALSISLGAIFFVAIQHLTRSSWSVTLRRPAEIVGASIVGPVVLLLPVVATLLMGSSIIFSWNDAELVAGDKILLGKQAFLNAPFFAIRSAVYVGVWLIAGLWLLRTSLRQDRTGDKQITLLMEGRSAPLLIAMALTTTFAAFDWLMSLDPHWFSTIYGIYIFSGGMVGALAVLSIVAAVWVKLGLHSNFVTKEHLHDIVKLLFGFNCFWAYIAFSQYLLIWYANIPEETIWLKHRQDHGWDFVTQLLVFGHFIIPFIVLMPRGAKRNINLVIGMSLWLLLMHWVDMYWLVYPQFAQAPAFGAIEVCGLVFVVCATAITSRTLSKGENAICLRDPRLEESVSHHVV